MHGGSVERIVAVGDAQKAGGLLEGFLAQAWYVEQRFAVGEGAVLIAVSDDVAGQRAVESRDAGEQRDRCRVDIDADRIDAVLDDGIQSACQFALTDVVLVLPDADRLWLDLDEFRKRILQTSGNRHSAA